MTPHPLIARSRCCVEILNQLGKIRQGKLFRYYLVQTQPSQSMRRFKFPTQQSSARNLPVMPTPSTTMACHHIPPLVDPLQLLQVFIEYVQRLERLHDLPNGVSPPGGIMLQVPKKGGAEDKLWAVHFSAATCRLEEKCHYMIIISRTECWLVI